MKRLFCFGLGYSAGVLTRVLIKAGWQVAATRRPESLEDCRDDPAGGEGEAVTLFPFDRDHPLNAAGRDALARASHVLSSIPPDEDGDPVLDHHGAALGEKTAWIGYLSTTGVYGDRQGAWVDEDSPCYPSHPRTRRRLAAEERWLALGSAARPVRVFRLAGIYGPGRNPLDQLRAGTARRINKPGQVFSRIHVADIAATLAAAMKAEEGLSAPVYARVYNVCDDEPAPPQEVVAHGAALLGVTPPPEEVFEAADLSPMARSFYADNKRVSNRRIKEELGVRLCYPTYREGLRALAREAEAAHPPARDDPPGR